MQRTFTRSALLLLTLLTLSTLSATSWVGGELTYRQTGPTTLEVTATLCTRANLTNDSILIAWDDGAFSQVPVINGLDEDGNGLPDGELITPSLRKLVYRGVHTYAEAGVYYPHVQDPNRVGGICNVNPPNSDQIRLYIEAMVTIHPDWAGLNHSPVLLELPVDTGNIGMVFEHTPNAFDPDDDSLAYELKVPLQDTGTPVPAYRWPYEVSPGPDNQLTINPATGLVRWDAPPNQCRYAVAICIRSYRDGVHIGTVMRDMLITVLDEDNLVPRIELDASEDIVQEVGIGDTVQVQVTGSEFFDEEEVVLTASSGLFELLPPPADFDADPPGNPTTATFQWIVDEAHLRQYPIQVVFKARETNGIGQSDLAVLRYRVTDGTTSAGAPLPPGASIRVFPNPSPTGQVQLELTGFNAAQPFRLYDAAGRLLLTGQAQPGRQTLLLPELDTGLYLLRIGDRWTERIVIPNP